MQSLINNKLEHIRHISLTVPYRKRVVIDDRCNGLRFVASNNGSTGSWVRRYKDKEGKMKQNAFAKYPDVPIDAARDYVESVRGRDDYLLCAGSEPTIGVLIEKYLTEYISANRDNRSQISVRSALTKNLRPITGVTLDKVNAALLHNLILTAKKRAPSMAKLMRSELKQAWSYALAIGLTNVPCPITSLTGGRFKEFVRDRILNDTELPQLIKYLDIYSENLADVIIICLYTGMRSGEVCAINADYFETIDGVLWLTTPRECMKNDLAHRVPLFGKARDVIEKRLKAINNIGYLYTNSRKVDKPIQQVTLSREVYRVHGIVTNWHLHDLRRTARTSLQRLGCPFEVSEAIMAHKLPGVSSIYARYQYNDEKIKWLTELAYYYEGKQIS